MDVQGDDAIRLALAQRLAEAILTRPGALGASPPNYATLRALSAAPSADTHFDESNPAARITRAIDALVDGLRSSGEEALVAVLIDDLHLLDDASRRIIAGCVARLHTSRVLLVLASRESLTASIPVASRQHIALEVLSVDDAAIRERAAAPASKKIGVPDVSPPVAATSKRSRAARWLTQPVFLRGSPRALPLLAAGGLALVFIMMALRKETVAETLTVIDWRDDSIDTQLIEFGENDARKPLYRFRFGSAHLLRCRNPERGHIAPDGETMAVQIETDGANTIDIIGVRRDAVVALATGHRDDAIPAWSPDGTMLAFSTNCWSLVGNEGCDIAVRDVK